MSKNETRDELAKLTVDALRGKAKEKAIKGAWNMTKDQLLFELTKDQPKATTAAKKDEAKVVINKGSVLRAEKAVKAPKAKAPKAPKTERRVQNRRPQVLKFNALDYDAKKLGLTPQATAILDVIADAKTIMRTDLIAKLPAKFAAANCSSKQDPKHVLSYYLPILKRHGLVTLSYAPEVK